MKKIKMKELKIILSIFFVFSLLGFNITKAATLSFSPISGTYTVGSSISVDILVSSEDKVIKSTSGLISFSPDLLSVSSISLDDSIVASWAQKPSFSNTSGNINFEDEISSPGYIGISGKLFTVIFKVKSLGLANISFLAGSVIAADNIGTNVLSSLNNASFNISTVVEEPEIVTIQEDTGMATETPKITSMIYSNLIKFYDTNNPKFFIVLISFVVLILLLVFLLWHARNKSIRNRKKLKKEVYEVEDALHQNLDSLRESIQEQIMRLEKVKTKRQLTIEEEKIIKQLRRDLEDAENNVKKEIKDIEDLVKKK